MIQLEFRQLLIILAEFFVLFSFILAIYTTLLNVKESANRLVGLILLVVGSANLASVWSLNSGSAEDARLPFLLLAASLPAVGPTITLVILAIVRPEWISGKWRWLRLVIVLLALLPALLVGIDAWRGTSLYFSGAPAGWLPASSVDLINLIRSPFGFAIYFVDVIGCNLAAALILFYIAFLDLKIPISSRRLARWLAAIHFLTVVLTGVLDIFFFFQYAFLAGSVILVLGYTFAAFSQFIASRRLVSGRLQPRLITLLLVITLPTTLFSAYTVGRLAQTELQQASRERLAENGRAVQANLTQWLSLNGRALQYLVSLPSVQSMEPEQQQPALEQMARSYPYMYLVSTTDASGMNIARSDNQEPIDYSDRRWFQAAIAGAPFTIQVLVDSNTGRSALVAAAPVRAANGQVVGVGMFAAELKTLTEILAATTIGNTGLAYVVDDLGNLVAHPSFLTSDTVGAAYSSAPPALALRTGTTGSFLYNDRHGTEWQSYLTKLENGWGIVVQQQTSELYLVVRFIQTISIIVTLISTLALAILTWGTLNQAFKPIKSLTAAAVNIAEGDLSLSVPIESEDEFGTLANAFNMMTSQLRGIINSLEKRIMERTRDLQARTQQLQAASQVGRAVATIRNQDELLDVVARLISERFGFYHVGIFMLNEQGDFAVLKAANSEGGKRMLARNHMLAVGKQGIVGYVTANREARVALNVGVDAVHFNNPDLPETQSELALPLLIGDQLIGALDVQSVHANAFSQQDIEILQTLADQVAIALSNTLLLQQTQELLEVERRTFEQISQQAWKEFTSSSANLGFTKTSRGLQRLSEIHTEVLPGAGKPLGRQLEVEAGGGLLVPIEVRGQQIGIIRLRKSANTGSWSEDETQFIQQVSQQLGAALESARLFQDTQRKAERERITSQIVSRMRSTNDPQTIMQTAVQELRQALGVHKAQIYIQDSTGAPSNGNGHPAANDAGIEEVVE